MNVRGRIGIDREKCKGCYLCIRACPQGVIAADGEANAQGVYPAKPAGDCAACGNCFMVCPDICIRVFEYENEAAGEGGRRDGKR